MDGVTAEMLKYGGEIVVDWMVWICNLAWEQSKQSKQSKGAKCRYTKEKARERNVTIIGV